MEMNPDTDYPETMKYLFIIEKAGRNLSGYFPDVPGCVTTGKSVEKAVSNAREALELHLEDAARPPRARSLSWHLEKGGLKLTPTDVITWIPYEPAARLTAA